MSKTDEFDRRRARAYAWRFVRPGEKAPDPEPAEDKATPADTEGEAEPLSEAETEQAREQAYRDCEALAGAVDRAWALPAPEQAPAVAQLLLRAGKLGLDVVAMLHFPQQSVRLMRLAVRCRDSLPEEARDAATDCVLWLDYTHPEVVDLLVEVAIAGDSTLGAGIQMALHDENAKAVARAHGASARFARLLDEGPSETARRLALRWLHVAGLRDALPAVRRILRGRHFGLSFRALELLEEKAPEAVDADDLVFLLDELEEHPAPEALSNDENREAHTVFPDLVRGAVARLRPAGAAASLSRTADSEREGIFSGLGGFNATWALCTLAAAFPEQAVPRIDQLLRRVEWDRRKRAVEAAGQLPDELAWPRLLEAAADAVPEVAARAQEIWLQRRGSLCPLDELAGVDTALLDAPPSERMLSRLAMLRRAPLDARAAMLEVLCGEAPDPEALVLLLFVGSDSHLWTRQMRPGLPTNAAQLCRAIVGGFGPRGAEGLCTLAARYPEGHWGGWLDALSELVTKGDFPQEAFAALRAVATRRITELPGDARDDPIAMHAVRDALVILAKVGAPPDLAPVLWSLAWDPGEQSSYFRDRFRDAVVGALQTLPEGAPRQGDVIEKMEAALAAADLPLFAHAACFGLRLGIPAAIPLCDRALADHMNTVPADSAIIDALEACLKELDPHRPIGDRFTLQGARPGTVAFCLAARRSFPDATPQDISALREAMSSGEPTAAAEAATALLRAGAIGAQDEELIAVAARAPLRARSELVWHLLNQDAPPRRLWHLLPEILTSADPDVAEHFDCLVYPLSKSDVREDLVALAPEVLNPSVYARMQDCLPLDEPEATYWEDREEEDEEHDEDDEDDEDR